MHIYINPLYTNGKAINSGIINSFVRPIIYIKGYQAIIKTILYFLSKDIFFYLNSADPDEIPHYLTFHLGLNCL